MAMSSIDLNHAHSRVMQMMGFVIENDEIVDVANDDAEIDCAVRGLATGFLPRK